ncbi:1-phosphofructokinase family hexose kinase [Corynebacterium sp. ES2794-CONJ1]|uniref:1-phosphofructokinase family hexose kinase n=1 Tax=unclassified Corynebacterium TaxID=2624378 RepID=UPI0021699D07|nr:MULTISPECIES: 1-phosphofructokinase family hexose kinase [unclassified Corynebacterium]MCS4489172.1 1-phosphofructokinase family hexose kinase [Corynebacterium sp. ES2775-CONJ]MCS4490985.1 1-phosphofructokinase family hexose kinase [Corynebacterium sp. ES2715-CONJ3]MCS4531134.1 1-phosphofructokinase family hexose kinase [Corynebacterium sp. ES2730-CONJ]MCU9518501.1 1-phosphofructokinase family hexose kinase [Corynebacterium sp. ES2794-CONJ1]
MIVTLTTNPSIDTTFLLNDELRPGGVHRMETSLSSAGGKGINVSHAIFKADRRTLAVFPCSKSDPLLPLIRQTGIPYRNLETLGSTRVNTTLSSPKGITTKLNGQGASLNRRDQLRLVDLLLNTLDHASWVVLAGSLPPGTSPSFYTELITLIKGEFPHLNIAVDTSDAPLQSVSDNLLIAAPDLLTPNSFELGQIIGIPGEMLEKKAFDDNIEPIILSSQKILKRGVKELLITLGAAGAILATESGIFFAKAPHINVRSTVGAGDCALAGYLMGRTRGLSYPDSLALATAYGCAAASLPGTEIPDPAGVHPERIKISQWT